MTTRHFLHVAAAVALAAPLLTACSDDDGEGTGIAGGLGDLTESASPFGKDTGNFTAAEWYPGGDLGTTTQKAYSVNTADIDADEAMMTSFNKGITFFEKVFTQNEEPRKGLGPAWVRTSCIHCHPSYGHGKRQTEYRASTMGNGYLLVVYHPDAAMTTDGVRYTT